MNGSDKNEKWSRYCGENPNISRLVKGMDKKYGRTLSCRSCVIFDSLPFLTGSIMQAEIASSLEELRVWQKIF
jgi:hypothetical protein